MSGEAPLSTADGATRWQLWENGVLVKSEDELPAGTTTVGYEAARARLMEARIMKRFEDAVRELRERILGD